MATLERVSTTLSCQMAEVQEHLGEKGRSLLVYVIPVGTGEGVESRLYPMSTEEWEEA